VIICADHDANGVGECAARSAAERWLSEGRRVRIALPPKPGTDFNDVLAGRGSFHQNEVRHV
jgi:putative DNA primase/helicase